MAAASPTPVAYVPALVPTLPGSAPTFLAKELRAIRTTLDGIFDFLPRPVTSAPDNPRNGMIRKAVSPWRPVVGQTTDRWVEFDGTNWVYHT